MKEKIPYMDVPGRRILDLRPDGVACIPVLSLTDLKALRASAEEHIHPGCLEVCLCLRGNLAFSSGGKIYPFLPGNVFVSTPRQPHHLRTNPKGLKVLRILFSFPKLGQRVLGLDKQGCAWLSRTLANLPRRTFAASAGVKDGFERLFNLYDTERENATARRTKLRAATLSLLIAVIEAANHLSVQPSRKIETLAARMRKSPQNSYPILEMARECALSRAGFIEAFRRRTGLPPHAYLLDCRIKAAERMLQASNRSITAIAGELGFSSCRHFATVFRRTTGMSPTEKRKNFHPQSTD